MIQDFVQLHQADDSQVPNQHIQKYKYSYLMIKTKQNKTTTTNSKQNKKHSSILLLNNNYMSERHQNRHPFDKSLIVMAMGRVVSSPAGLLTLCMRKPSRGRMCAGNARQ